MYDDKIMNFERVCVCLFWLTVINMAQNGTEKLHQNYSQRFFSTLKYYAIHPCTK